MICFNVKKVKNISTHSNCTVNSVLYLLYIITVVQLKRTKLTKNHTKNDFPSKHKQKTYRQNSLFQSFHDNTRTLRAVLKKRCKDLTFVLSSCNYGKGNVCSRKLPK